MDTLTHALSGALLARASAPAAAQPGQLSLRSRLAAGFLAGAFPDSDIVIRFFTDPITYLNLHRGVTHSLPLLPLWALLLAGLFALLWRRCYDWRAFYGVAALALAIHLGGDLITTYGTKLLAPFSDYKAAVPTTFIIDLYFTAIIAAGLLASWVWRHQAWPSRLALLVLAGYVGFQGLQLGQARALGEQYAATAGLARAEVAALPQPLSPFNWKIIVRSGENYHIAHVNLWRLEVPAAPAADAGFFARTAALYQPVDALQWEEYPQFGAQGSVNVLAREAWVQPAMGGYRDFAEYPALYAVEENGIGTCVWFNDLRFALGQVRTPFLFGVCRAYSDQPWRLYRLSAGVPVKL